MKDPATVNPATQHEPADINFRILAWVGLAFVLGGLLAHLGLFGFMTLLDRYAPAQVKPAAAAAPFAPPAPRLQTAPPEDEAVLRADQLNRVRAWEKAAGYTGGERAQ